METLRAALASAALALTLAGCVAAVGAGAAAGASAAYDRRTAGTIIDDEVIEIKALEAIVQDKALFDNAHINVTSYNNMVLLTGEVPDKPLRASAESAVARIEKVRGVYNELVIAEPSSMLSRSRDTIVTGKVKASLIRDKIAPGGRTKVVTEAGTVFLMGLLTRSEANRITEIARRIGGVQRVVKLFEYLD